jgi:hypothetical protein
MVSMKGCISYCLFGDDAKYSFGAVENAIQAREFYPGWHVVFHVERGHYAIPRLRREGAEVVEMPPAAGCDGMFWRFLAAERREFTHVIFRDCDSRLSAREAMAVREWTGSGLDAHSLRDNGGHHGCPLLGGGWGIVPGALDIAGMVGRYPKTGAYGCDENFLASMVWPEIFPSRLMRHSDDPVLPFERPWRMPRGEFHFGERVEPRHRLKIRSVVLSPERYAERRSGFFRSVSESGCCVGDVEWWRGKSIGERAIPPHVEHAEAHPHYYLASRDHLDILERSLLAGDEYLLVFEDDARIEPDFDEYFHRMLVALPEDWLGAMLGGSPWSDDCREHVDPPMPPALARVRGCLGMHAVLWNRKGIRRAFDHFSYWGWMVIDQAFRGLQNDDPRFYAPAKWIVGIDPEAKQYGQDR